MLPRIAVLTLAVPALFAADHARESPEWVRSGVIYEINTRTFSAAGNFRGVEERLDDLRALGVNILWLMPIHPIGEARRKGTLGSPYSVRDYYAIDPAYGTPGDLKHLVGEAHRRGFKIILDMVANHTAWDSVMMKHPAWYRRDAAGKVISPVPEWSDVAGLNYAERELRAYMLEMLKHWVRDFDLDGFRCDVAFMVPTDFWEQARSELARIKPDIVLLAEAHVPELLVRAFDLDYAWPFHSTLTEVFEKGAPADALRASWEQERRKYPIGAMEMRFSDDHDEKRAIARFGDRGALAASALVFTLDGVPMLYNGMEAGDTSESAGPALFEPLHVFWQAAELRPEFPVFYAAMIALRRAHAALQQGETEWIANADPARVLTYSRKGGGEEFLIAINCSSRPFFGTVEAAGRFSDVTPGRRTAAVALPVLSLDAWGFRIFRREP
ncbi:MAG: DUF3459 domain-containing protein [Acidobacteriia bacterium]|nr:DUF3459 domain-containing protein [Terriglobia bacterium]